MPHWLETVLDIFSAKTTDLRELAKLAGGDPRTFYRGATLDGADLSGQDLRGMEFSYLDIRAVATDANTKLDPKYGRVPVPSTSTNSVHSGTEVDSPEGALERAKRHARALDLLAAIRLLRASVDRFPRAPALRKQLSQYLVRIGDISAAHDVLRLAVHLFPDEPLFVVPFSLTLRRLEQVKEAIAFLIDASVRFPAHDAIRLALARASGDIDPESAIRLFENLILETGSTKALKSFAQMLLAKDMVDRFFEILKWPIVAGSLLKLVAEKAAREPGFKERIVRFMDESLPREGEFKGGVIKRYAETMISLGYAERGLQVLDDALRSEPHRAELYKWYGDALLSCGRFESAVALLEDATKRFPESLPVFKWLFDAYVKSGERKRASRLRTDVRQRFGLEALPWDIYVSRREPQRKLSSPASRSPS